MIQLQKNIEFLDKSKDIVSLNIGERLKLARIMLRKPQKTFGSSLNSSQTAISAYELNKHKPKKDFINLCAEIYNINPNYLTQGIKPMFLKEQTPLVKIEVVGKAQSALINKNKTKQTPNIQIVQNKKQDKASKLDIHNDEVHLTYPTLQQKKCLDSESSIAHLNPQPNLHKTLLPITPNPSYNVFSFKDIELDIVVYESKIYFSFANISKIVGYALMNELMFCIRTFSQDELKKACFRTFKELNTYYKDEVYVEYKAFAACYKGHKNKDIIAFLDYAKSIESNLKQYSIQDEDTFLPEVKETQLQTFQWENSTLDYGMLNGEPVFNLNYIGSLLDIKNPRTSIDINDTDYIIKVNNSVVGLTYNRNLNNRGELFLTEAGLYRLLLRSDKPEAEKFSKWVTKEVLPAIRKTGRYKTKHNTFQNSQCNYDKVLNLALMQVNQHQRLIEHNQALILENERYKALFKRDGEFTLMEVAKLFEISTFELKNFLIKENLITNYARSNKQYPTQYAKDNGFVKMKLTDTKRVSYDIYLTLALIEKLKEFFSEV